MTSLPGPCPGPGPVMSCLIARQMDPASRSQIEIAPENQLIDEGPDNQSPTHALSVQASRECVFYTKTGLKYTFFVLRTTVPCDLR